MQIQQHVIQKLQQLQHKMAKGVTFKFKGNTRKKRRGVHSKNASRTKGGKQYVKPYVGQGR